MPNAPWLNALMQRLDSQSEYIAASEGYGSKQQRRQEFVACILAEPKRLQQIKYQKYDGTIYSAVSQPVIALWKWIFAC